MGKYTGIFTKAKNKTNAFANAKEEGLNNYKK